MSFLEKVETVANGMRIITTLGESYTIIYDDKIAPHQKIRHVGINIIYVVAQSIEMGTKNADLITQFAAKVFAGLGDVLRESYRSKFSTGRVNHLNITGIGTYRVAEIMNLMIKMCPKMPPKLKKISQSASTILKSIGILLSYENVRKFVGRSLSRIRFGQRRQEIIQEYDERFIADIHEITKTLEQVIIIRFLNGRIEEITPEIIDLTVLEKVPEMFFHDNVLRQRQCPISQKPIRYIVIVEGTQNTKEPVFYEKNNIEKWILENEEEQPPKWPDHILVSREALTVLPDMQSEIDQRLEILIIDFVHANKEILREIPLNNQ